MSILAHLATTGQDILILSSSALSSRKREHRESVFLRDGTYATIGSTTFSHDYSINKESHHIIDHGVHLQNVPTLERANDWEN